MHLFYLNVTHQMYEHWQISSSLTYNEFSLTENPESLSPVKEKYSIPQHLWKNIDEDLIKSAKLFPSSLGEQVRSLKGLKKGITMEDLGTYLFTCSFKRSFTWALLFTLDISSQSFSTCYKHFCHPTSASIDWINNPYFCSALRGGILPI